LLDPFKRGVYAAALIKKQKYWPRYIDGKAIKRYFKDKDVGAMDAWGGRLDGVTFDVFGMKKPNYVMKVMSCQPMACWALLESRNFDLELKMARNG